VGAIAASNGAGTAGYERGFFAIGVVMAVTTVVAFALKNRVAERATAANAAPG
jgi:hypothetical protein